MVATVTMYYSIFLLDSNTLANDSVISTNGFSYVNTLLANAFKDL